ncbi:MAG: bifunctional 23S rRNA (guanine(2069)-N(7))-methyltransferase RlmK/23S rRNA (guanine(2445)-N(2))-methyltransferase RlmL [Gammaproteobacteria bacterium]
MSANGQAGRLNEGFVVTAPKGVTEVLRGELKALGVEPRPQGPAALSCEGSLADAYRVCLWSRLANRVLMPLYEAQVASPEALHAWVMDLPWEEHLTEQGTLAVDCTSGGHILPHTKYAALKVKDAICDRFRARTGERPSVDTETPDIALNLHVRNDRARLSLDLSGGSLHRRGYRTQAGEAPLKENLAAALLIRAGWRTIAPKGAGLYDPLCGSGTLLIEAAMIALDVAPGLTRTRFGFSAWLGHDHDAWSALHQEAEKRRAEGAKLAPVLVGCDVDTRVLSDAAANALRAGVADFIRFEHRHLSAKPPKGLPERGLLITNPPYGERLGDVNELSTLYSTLGDLMQALPRWRAAVFTGNPDLAAYIGAPADRGWDFFNGPIECRLLLYGDRPELGPEARMFANRLRKNLKHLGRWARRAGVGCYRVYDSDLPEFAFAVDLYTGSGPDEGRRWAHVQEYQAPARIDPDKAERRRLGAVGAVAEVLELPRNAVVLKRRQQQKGREQYQRMEQSGHFHQVDEGPARLRVNLTDYLDTGLFLDHRPVRALLRDRARGKRFLNLFCYTATATVQAALGGAERSLSLDMSQTYLDWAEQNFRLNGMDLAAHRLKRVDCLDWLRNAPDAGERFDLVFMDPPTFSNSKRMEGVLDVQRDHVALIRAAMDVLNPGGCLVFSNNFRRFRLDAEALSDLVVADITRTSLDEDFKRNPRIHQCWTIERPS